MNRQEPPGYWRTRAREKAWVCLGMFGPTRVMASRAKVDGFVPRTQHVNLRIFGQTD